MHLTRLELSGFKSFAQKTVLEFAGPITAVVGPNGSGKSNIIDAFRWILGEREAKQMRGARAEDLIFAGTAHVPGMSLAQAAIVFDNKDHFFPVDYSEIIIRRKIGRDGTSEYFLNDAAVRLKDILDFFAKSRMGTKGFSIINQGESDLFVRALPKERRAMLEEVLGLKQFQIKKHDADLKLKATVVNLEKANALLQEMTPHVRMLRRQTSRWEKHGELVKELEMLQQGYFSVKLRELVGERDSFLPEEKKTEEAIAHIHKELGELERELGTIEKHAPGKDNAFNELEERRKGFLKRRTEIEREMGRLEAQIEFAQSRAESPADAERLSEFLHELRGNLEELAHAEDLEEVTSMIQQIVTSIDALLEESRAEETPAVQGTLKETREKLLEERETLDRALRDIEEAEKSVRARFQSFNAEFTKAFHRVEAKRGELGALEAQRNRLMLQSERVRMREEELQREARETGQSLEAYRSVTPPADFDVSRAERAILRLRGELAAIGEIDKGLLKEAEEAEKRFAFLGSQTQDLEKAVKDLRVLIEELDKKIHTQFHDALVHINREFQKYFEMMFGGGKAKLVLIRDERLEIRDERLETRDEKEEIRDEENGDSSHAVDHGGLEVEISIPKKKIRGLEMLSGGERSLVSIAVLFALISVSPPPFIVLDEVDAALDDANTKRFADLVKGFAGNTQFVIVTHNRATMEAANVLYGVTMKEDGTSRVLSLKLE